MKQMTDFYKVSVNWDTDGINPEELNLPEVVDIPAYINEDEVADWLSDNYGYCVYSWVEL